MSIYNILDEILHNYFLYLKNFGYLKQDKVNLILLASFLINSLEYFKEYINESYLKDVNRILKSLDCCNCLITFDNCMELTTLNC